MADSTSNIDQIQTGQSAKETAANSLFDMVSQGMAFGRRLFGVSAGLTWAYYGIARWYINATATTKANSTVSLTASGSRFVSVDRALAVTEVASAFAPDKLALYRADTGPSSVTAYEDHRDPHHINRFLYGRVTIAMGGSSKVLTYEQAMCESIELTGNNGSVLDVTVPAVPRAWTVFANTTTNGVRVIAASGTGTTIAVGKTAIVEFDGTNVRRITADNP